MDVLKTMYTPFLTSPMLAVAGVQGLMCVGMGFRMSLFHSATMANTKVDELHKARVSKAQMNNAEWSPYIMLLQIGIHLSAKSSGVPLSTTSLCAGVGATLCSAFYILGTIVYVGNWKTVDPKPGYQPPFFRGVGAMGRYLSILVMCLELFRYC